MAHRHPAVLAACLALAISAPAQPQEPVKRLLWGDTHLHTNYSFDAFLNNNLTADPDTAYRFAKGQPVTHPYHRARVQLRTPLDFLVVSDHAEYLGGLRDIYRNGLDPADAGPFDSIRNWYATRVIRRAIDAGEGAPLFVSVLPESEAPRQAARTFAQRASDQLPVDPAVASRAWREVAEAADAHYQPGRFSTFIGWEWSSIPGGANLHRVVVSDANVEQAVQFLPFASSDSPYPSDLWRWLAQTSARTGVDFVAIPHNSNISKGLMFDAVDLRGDAMNRAGAEQRRRWEPIVEVTQIKGDSETHPRLSPEDEFADFETYSYYIQQQPEPYDPRPGDYMRSGLRIGLELADQLGINPFAFGVIGSTDAHTGLASAEENNFWGKMATDSTPETKINPAVAGGARGWTMSAAGLAAVWATDNTREAIMAALRRRETYATTGPRIRLQVFGGWDFAQADLDAPSPPGVPMGGELANPPAARAPTLLIRAAKDPLGANLDRVQVVKGWLDPGDESREQVFNVAWSGQRALDGDGRLPAVGDTVDRSTGATADSIGAETLEVVWSDPQFDPAQAAFYYVRVLQIPTARHALLDALALGMSEPSVGASVIQERAYSSPIWYHASAGAGEASAASP